MDEEDCLIVGPTKCKQNDFKFIPPPEAPVFEPSLEEFHDPILYIDSIKSVALKTGICKIRPPPEWQPPFALDIEKFKFTPRLQRLNELEAKTRIKLNFLDQIAKFWELQGCTLKIPMVERRILDLYSIHQIVADEGGFSIVSKQKKWIKVANRMNYINAKSTGTLLKTHYERILYPYDVFKERELSKAKQSAEGICKKNDEIKAEFPDNRLSKTEENSSSCKETEQFPILETEKADCKELNRLKFYGAAGPKMLGFQAATDEKIYKNPIKKEFLTFDPLAKYVCKNCQRGDVEESMLLCDGCDDSYHTFCLMPPLSDIPKGDWRCPKCIANEVKKPVEAFGFEQAQQEYTLHQFGEMADRFKSDYFNMPVHRVPTSLVEKEFWRLVSSIDEDVCVEYGADLHSVEHGSGFPTKKTSNLDEDPSLKAYIESGWNLNNIPILEDSVLSHINADISGMKVPWMYVGMCFSTFCWHNEDHWSYSINYLHWGEPKTWYGVPGCHADNFENTMKKAAPELFENQPDLLHQLVTILNPNVLMKEGVPVYRTDQQAGEFVITFPRAYHAGFNQGYNFAEAVNFAPVDWLKMGRECINYYSKLHRYCVFSHDELVCKMAMDAEKLHPKTAAATYQDLLTMIETEKKLRKSLLDWGVCDAEREAFELLPDDERQCEVCKTTCFLSAVSCRCKTSQLVCIRHYSSYCDCPPKNHVLRYRYTLDEMPVMLQGLKKRADSYDKWVEDAKSCMDKSSLNKLDLQSIKNLVREAEERNYPKCKLKSILIETAEEAEKCSSVASELLKKKSCYRSCMSGSCKLTFEELKLFFDKLNNLHCTIPELDEIKVWVEEATQCLSEATDLLKTDSKDLQRLTICWLTGLSLGLDSYELKKIKPRLDLASWLFSANEVISGAKKFQVSYIQALLIEAEDLDLHSSNSEVSSLKSMILSAKNWEDKTKQALSKLRINRKIDYFEELLKEGQQMNIFLPTMRKLSDKITSMKSIISTAEDIIRCRRRFSLQEIKEAFKQIQSLPFAVQYVPSLQQKITESELWLKEAGELFLNDSKLSLLEVLCPVIDDRLNNKKMCSKDIEVLTDNIEKLIENLKSGIKSENLLEINVAAKRDLINNLKSIQLFNIRKKLNARKNTEFCICRKQLQGVMYECSLCRDWFHEACVSLIKKIKHEFDDYGFDLNFICQYCTKSKRPSQIQVIKLLLKLEKLKILLPEGEALKLLFERALFFQIKFKETFSSDELKGATKKLSVCRLSKDEPRLNLRTSFLFEDELESRIKWQVFEKSITNDDKMKYPMLPKYCIEMDHNYFAGGPLVDMNKKHVRKSPLTPRDMGDGNDELPISLSKTTILALKELFNEGGVIEIKMNENQIIWRLLQASVPHKVQKNFGCPKLSVKHPMKHSLKSSKNGIIRNKRKLLDDTTAVKRIKKLSKEGNDLISSTVDSVQIKKKDKKNELNQQKNVKVESCAAYKCSRPVGSKIDWVQCDGKCNDWFHMTCVGLDKKKLKKNDDYFCPNCKRP